VTKADTPPDESPEDGHAPDVPPTVVLQMIGEGEAMACDGDSCTIPAPPQD
jgi:hypothetical protein